MALRRLAEAVPDFHERLELIPLWTPEAAMAEALAGQRVRLPAPAMSAAKHRYLLADVKRLAARLGLAIAWPVDAAPRWELPHLAYLRARDLGAGAAFYDAAVAARWERREDICDEAVLARLGESVGAGGAALAAAWRDPATRAAGAACLTAAYHDDIFGVPYFRVGRHRFFGFDRVDDFVDAYTTALERSEVP